MASDSPESPKPPAGMELKSVAPEAEAPGG